MTLGPLMIDVAGQALTPDEVDRLKDSRIGGVILFTRNYDNWEQMKALVAAIHAVRTPSLLVAVDQEGGRIQRFREGFTALPPARWLGHQYDIDPDKAKQLARICGWIMAAELLEVGIDISFAPVVDLDLGLSDVIGDRAFHKEPDIVATLADSYMGGMREAGMVAVAKHFPGHGAVIADSHLELPEDHRHQDDMDDDLLPYRRLIANGLSGVMMAHVRYPEIDRRIASMSPFWMQTALRYDLAFRGAIFSDDLNMSATIEMGNMSERVLQTLQAGADMAIICNNPDAVVESLAELDEIGDPVSQARLVALRPQVVPVKNQVLRETETWRTAVNELTDAAGRPSLKLDG